MQKINEKNIIPENFPLPTREACDKEYLDQMYKHVVKETNDAIAWYMREKRGSRFFSRLLRFWIIVFTSLGGIIPLVFSTGLFNPRIASPLFVQQVNIGQFGYISLAVAGSLLLLDRFFGYSTGWMRYTMAGIHLQQILADFETGWAINSARGKEKDLCETQLQYIRKYMMKVRAEVEKETGEWAAEYKSNLREMEKTLQKEIESTKPGAIDLSVPDINKFKNRRATVLVDDTRCQTLSDETAQIQCVFPGEHWVTVKGVNNKMKEIMGSEFVRVSPGQITSVQVDVRDYNASH